jgi:hypothetical protein
VLERTRVLVDVLMLLTQGEVQHDLIVAFELPFQHQRFHLGDMVALPGLDAQVRAQVVGETVTAIERDHGVAMILGGCEQSHHALGGGQIEQVLRNIRARRDRAAKQVGGPLVASEQAEDGAERVERFRRLPGARHGADDFRRRFGGREGLAGLA